MSEVYWLGGADQTGWEKETFRLGIRPAWIEEAHWFGMPEQTAWLAHPPSFTWPELPGLQLRMLQDCARLLLAGERSLVLLASPAGVALLASPRAIGRLNLVPAVRLNAWGSLPTGSAWETAKRISAIGAVATPANPIISGAWQALYPPAPPPILARPETAPFSLPTALLERCEALRQEIHDPAELLWQLLDDRQINQAEFSHNQELDGQTLDFFCPQAGLVVLIDHRADIEDAHRMHVFAQHGLNVLRFWNSQVIEDTPEVLQTIWRAVTGPEINPPASVTIPQPSAPALTAAESELTHSPGGVAGLNVLCCALQPGWRGSLIETDPQRPVTYLSVERL